MDTRRRKTNARGGVDESTGTAGRTAGAGGTTGTAGRTAADGSTGTAGATIGAAGTAVMGLVAGALAAAGAPVLVMVPAAGLGSIETAGAAVMGLVDGVLAAAGAPVLVAEPGAGLGSIETGAARGSTTAAGDGRLPVLPMLTEFESLKAAMTPNRVERYRRVCRQSWTKQTRCHIDAPRPSTFGGCFILESTPEQEHKWTRCRQRKNARKDTKKRCSTENILPGATAGSEELSIASHTCRNIGEEDTQPDEVKEPVRP